MNDDEQWKNLGFGFKPVPMMMMAVYRDGQWSDNPTPTRKRTIEIDPMSAVLSYGPAWFEGLKVGRTPTGDVVLFRHHENAHRAQRSAERLHMPPVSVGMFTHAVEMLVRASRDYVPPEQYGDLYIRPQSFGVEPLLGLRTGNEFVFTVSANPVGEYFQGAGVMAKPFLVSTEHCRATPGGTGDIKFIGNYGAVNKIAADAKAQGFAEVLYLDPSFRFVQEFGAANLFWVKDRVLYTPPLDGMVLPGVTRDSIIQIARQMFEMTVHEETWHVSDLLEQADEVFATGTAAGVTPVGSLTYQPLRNPHPKIYNFGDGETPGPITLELRNTLRAIQHGRIDCPFDGWLTVI